MVAAVAVWGRRRNHPHHMELAVRDDVVAVAIRERQHFATYWPSRGLHRSGWKKFSAVAGGRSARLLPLEQAACSGPR